MRFPVLALMTVLAAAPALAQEASPAQPMPATLQVTATAEVKGAPDIATISAGVVTMAPSASEALSQNAKQMSAVFDALKKAGVEVQDMQTSGISVNPQMDYRENQSPKVTGYQAINNVTVIVRKLDGLGSVLDTLVGQGANQISGPTFAIDNPEPLLDVARAEAIGKARARADLYAKAAGVTIKRILNISEGQGTMPPPPMPMMRAMAMEAASTPVAQGQVQLATSITVTFELAQ